MTRKLGTLSEDTYAKLLESAKEEFYEKGYQKASLRQICNNADVTTGALYFFFKNKDDLFIHVISEACEFFLEAIKVHYQNELAVQSQNVSGDEEEDIRAIYQLLDYYYSHKEVCQIVLKHRDYPYVIEFFDKLTELLDKQTILIFQEYRELDSFTIHWLSHLQIDAFMQIISHDLDINEAKQQLNIMIHFLRSGFESLV
ncbi:MAG: TetR/AcrR family transcriptional regulator [Erysipelotrichaceae bacterium]|nr:TetR/AcrR family transcriptional regulator [Erysipelotrichaceae bacterium]